MWRSIIASQHYQSECIWEEHTKTIGNDGLSVTNIVQHEDIAIYFTRLPAKQKRTATGYFNVKAAEAIIPYIHLDDVNVSPSTHTSHIRRGSELWRVTSIDDYSGMIQNHCYTLELERVELFDQ